MVKRISSQSAPTRRGRILVAARWCFLNFGFAKTSLDDIARRVGISRTLLYKSFRDKEDIFIAVFTDWLVSRHPGIRAACVRQGSRQVRLLEVCRLMLVEPWAEMAGAPMAAEFYEVCERLHPEAATTHRQMATQSVATVLEDQFAAEVFLLALDGLLEDDPQPDVLEQRVQLLVDRFAPPIPRERGQ